MKLLTKLILIFLISNISKSLKPQIIEEWTARFNGGFGASIDGANKVLVDKSGNILVAGSSYGAFNNYDYTLIKYSSHGIQQWIRTYNGTGNGPDVLAAMTIDSENNIYVTGGSDGIGTESDCVTIKYDSFGNLMWVARYTSFGNHRDACYSISLDHSGNVCLSGESYNDSLMETNYCTLKYSADGTLRWIRKYPKYGTAYALVVDNLNNIVVTGNIADSPTQEDFATIKYDSAGNQLWIARYDGSAHMSDYVKDLVIDDSANIYVSGYTTGLNTGPDFTTIKYNTLGVLQWVVIYDGPSHSSDVVRSLAIDKKNNIYVTGSTIGPGTEYDWVTIKYNSDGIQQWITNYHNGPNDIPYSIAISNLGAIYITGQIDGSGTSYDYATIKYDSSGHQEWVKSYDYSGQYGDIASAIAVDNSENVYVTGSSNRDILTIKYSQLTGINTSIADIPSKFKLEQNYPNPFNPNTVISYELSVSSDVNLKVYDILGNEVATFVNQKQNAGNYNIEFDGSNLSSGIYFYRMEVDGNAIDTKRMILLK